MNSLISRITKSLGYRLEYQARKFCRSRERKRIEAELKIPSGHNLSADDLSLARILNKYGDRISALIDVGAHKGAFTRMARTLFDLDTVICVEPDPALHATLRNNIPEAARLVPEALSAGAGKARFYLHPDQSMSSLVPTGDEFDSLNPHYSRSEIKQAEVNTRTLDSLIELLPESSKRNVLLKIDVQGHEMDVLRSGSEILSRSSLVVCEYTFWHGYQKTYDLRDLVDWLSDNGFVARELVNVGYRGSSTSYADIVFVAS
jgi:FkbM family methyltransferase